MSSYLMGLITVSKVVLMLELSEVSNSIRG